LNFAFNHYAASLRGTSHVVATVVVVAERIVCPSVTFVHCAKTVA